MIYEKIHEKQDDTESTVPSIAYKALKMAALAAYTDYQLTPHRLQPGYEACLSKPSLTLVYPAFAAGLARRELEQRQRSRN